jgi:hypothetical protein
MTKILQFSPVDHTEQLQREQGTSQAQKKK